jgi:hypothetical protein
MTVRPFAFVLMPFTSDFDDVYKLGIQAACTEAGVLAERVDEQTYSETILERIYRQIQVCDFVIADMTGKNPNVFYEVGYTHARAKLCTLLTQSADDIPFDLKHHRHIVYDGSIQTLKSKLSVELDWLKGEAGKSKTQSITIEAGNTDGSLTKNDWSIVGELEIAFDLHNRSTKRSPDIDALYIYTSYDWGLMQAGEKCPITSSPEGPAKYKTFIKPPVQRLLPGGWAQIKLTGSRRLWDKWSGDEAKESYRTSSPIHIELHTSEGILKYAVPLTVEFEEVPF